MNVLFLLNGTNYGCEVGGKMTDSDSQLPKFSYSDISKNSDSDCL